MVLALRRCATRSSGWLQVAKRHRSDNAIVATETAQEPPSSQPKPRINKHLPKEIIFSGIQPTGVPHLGNYLGALRQWVQLQDEKLRKRPGNVLLFSVVDLHALTGKQTREERRQLRRETFASLLAIGLNSKVSNMFLQSSVKAHTELMWILSTVASTGYLSRMTQWKSKLNLPETATLNDDVATKDLKLGLFSYPVLQAADILLYRPTLVPVGEDQCQHIEFARQLARSFNSHYCGETQKPIFTLPRTKISSAKRIMSLREPSQKMSKSDADPKSRILITDSAEEIHNKVKSAVTDSIDGISYDRETRPGISNLIEILKHVTDSTQDYDEIAREHASLSKGAFKELVAGAIVKSLAGISDRFHEVLKPGNQEFIGAVDDGHRTAGSMAGRTMNEVYEALGFDPLHDKNTKRSKNENQQFLNLGEIL